MNSWSFTFIVGIITISLSVSGQEGHQTSNDNYYNLLHHYPFQEHSSEPVFLGESPMNEATVQVFPDGTIKVYHAPNRYSNEVMSMESKDGGFTWSEAEVIFEDSIICQYPRRTLIDNKGNIHLLVFQEPDLDVYHTATSDGGKTWKPLQKIANGRIGAIRGLIQTKSGRLIFGYHHHKWDRKPPYGSCYISFVYSDDYGETWEDSESQLVAPVFENYNGNNYGAVEPNLVQLSDDRIWMLCRTQTGWLYQSTSDDNGESWSEAEPSAFHSSNSPADLLKLPDGRIVATWCNTGDTDLKTFGKIYTNREVLHMAISDDDGNSWKGFREVFRIPTRNDQNDMPGGDSGVAYPNTAFTKDGKIILVTGQGEHGGGRAMFRISPEWLYETSQEDDFSNGLEKWSCYSFTKLGLKPGRMLGPELLLDEAAKGGKILHVRKAKSEIMGDGAVWNFPMMRKGELSMRVKAPEGSAGIVIALTDHHRHPNDPDGENTAMFSIDSRKFGDFQWQIMTIKWDLDYKKCDLYINENLHSKVSLINDTDNGISYLRFRSLAGDGTTDLNGIWIDWVKADVSD